MKISTPGRGLPHLPVKPLATALLACGLAGCASYEHAKGTLELKTGRTEDGIQSLERATQLAPTAPDYKIDYLNRREENVQEVLARAESLRAEGELEKATAAYELALRLDRGNARAKAALAALPQDARHVKLLADGEAYLATGKIDVALDRAKQVLEEHPQNRRAARLKEAALDAQAAADLAREKVQKASALLEKPVTLQFNDAPLRTVFEAISRSVGLNILVDRDVRPAARVTIFVKDISVGDAIDFILLQNQMEKRLVNSNTLIVYPSSDAKKAEYEDLTIRSFQITNADLRYLSSMLKSVLKLREVAADERSGILVIRDTPERLRMAARLIAVHDVADPEIMLEVEILEVTTGRRSNLGVVPPSGLTVSTPGTAGSLTIGALRALRTNDLLVTPLSGGINFKLEDSDAKLLASPRIRARNREKAKIMIGDRVPTITNSVTPLTTGSAVVTGNVTYQDVGLKLEFEPQVYADNEVGIKVSLDVSNIAAEFTDAQGGRSYQIGTRNASTNLRLKDGETQVLGGLITDQDRNVASKIPGLGHLPVVGRLFGNNDGSELRSEIVLAITPHIVRNLPEQPPEARSIFSGTLNGLREKPILAESMSQLKAGLALQGQPAAAGAQMPNVQNAQQPARGSTSPPAGVSQDASGVLFNPRPANPPPSTQSASPTQLAPMPVPPPMFVRPSGQK